MTDKQQHLNSLVLLFKHDDAHKIVWNALVGKDIIPTCDNVLLYVEHILTRLNGENAANACWEVYHVTSMTYVVEQLQRLLDQAEVSMKQSLTSVCYDHGEFSWLDLDMVLSIVYCDQYMINYVEQSLKQHYVALTSERHLFVLMQQCW